MQNSEYPNVKLIAERMAKDVMSSRYIEAKTKLLQVGRGYQVHLYVTRNEEDFIEVPKK